jgi:DNA-directed RNA polymerase specialized sigma24 family protein
MAHHPDDPTTASDLTLVDAARAGDRLAFGVLYLRHHAAAWRVACVVSRFSPDAELAVIEGFTRVFSALPAECEPYAAGGVRFRPYLLACVRQAALERARAAGRAHAAPAPLAGLAPDGEVVLSSLEHHVVRGALAALPERIRTTLWLSEVEAMTPNEISALLGGRPEEVATVVAAAQNDLHAATRATLSGHEVRANCRFTVQNLEEFQRGTLDPAKGVLVRSHLDVCPTCRMRLGELANGPATLAAAVPAAPLLGGETQHHWLTNAADAHPADRLFPPGLAASVRADLPGPTRRLAVAAIGVPEKARQAGRSIRPALPVVSLVVAWLAVMLSLPQLMQPSTAPGPAGLAMPAVQAYLPSYLPGAGLPRPRKATPAAPEPPGTTAGASTGTELAVQFVPAGTEEEAKPAVKLAATQVTPRRATPPAAPSPAPVLTVATPAITVAATVAPVVTSPALPAISPDGSVTASKALEKLQRRLTKLDQKLRTEATAITASFQTRRVDVASLRSKAREDFDGRVARQPARRRHPDHPESA